MNKQIKEKDLPVAIYMSGHGLDWADSKDIANQLYEQGYKKIPKGSVVFTKEEYLRMVVEEKALDKASEDQVRKQAVKEVLGKLKERFVRQEERFATNVTKFETDLNKVAENDLANAKYIIGKATGQATMAEKAQYYIDKIAKEMGVEI